LIAIGLCSAIELRFNALFSCGPDERAGQNEGKTKFGNLFSCQSTKNFKNIPRPGTRPPPTENREPLAKDEGRFYLHLKKNQEHPHGGLTFGWHGDNAS
jgi:hypothetical protein